MALTAAVFVIVFAQLLAVSRFDAVTVRAVLTSAGPTQVVLGTVVNSLPFMLVLVAIAVPTLLRMRGRVTGQYAHVFWALAFAASVTVIYFAVFLGLYSLPWVSFGILLGNALFLGLIIELDLRQLSPCRFHTRAIWSAGTGRTPHTEPPAGRRLDLELIGRHTNKRTSTTDRCELNGGRCRGR